MRYRDRLDCALIAASQPATTAAVFTCNRFCAAPIHVSRQHLEQNGNRCRAILVNAGIANACTGQEGIDRARRSAKAVSNALNIPETSVLLASTGVIGPQIDVGTMATVIPRLVDSLRPEGWEDAARAIMTTDTRAKMAWASAELDDDTISVGGIAKGSGMIGPNMATMLAFIATDATVRVESLQRWLNRANEMSFNSIIVDGDTSTNDTVFLMASGKSSCPPVDSSPEINRIFGMLLDTVCTDLACQLVEDGEGATKFVEIQVRGAAHFEDARKVGKTIATSPLVKTALYGADANWGRIVAAVGRAGVDVDPNKVSVAFGPTWVFRRGRPVERPGLEEQATKVLQHHRVTIVVDLGMGKSGTTIYTCDLSKEYVSINADYRS